MSDYSTYLQHHKELRDARMETEGANKVISSMTYKIGKASGNKV